MKKNNVGVKILVAVMAVIIILLAAVIVCYPKVILTEEEFTVEAGSILPEDVHEYAAFLSEKYADRAVLDNSEVNTGTVGEYSAAIVCGSKRYEFMVNVVDTTAPVLTLKEEVLNVTKGTIIKASEVAEAEDVSEVSIVFKDGDELADTYECQEGGTFELIVSAADVHGNETKGVLTVNVAEEDETAPVISGYKDITVYVGEKPDYLNGVSAADDVDGDVTDLIVVDDSKVNIKKNGKYKVIYKCSDRSGNEAKEEITLTVLKKKEAADNSTPSTTTATNKEVPSGSAGKENVTPQKEQKPESKPESKPTEAPKPESKPESKPTEAPKPERKPTEAPKPESKPENKPAEAPKNEEVGPDQLDMSNVDRDIMTPEEYDQMVQDVGGGAK